ncbi:MAG: UDP-3-O-(3-hydroxymyristoyl)glucosamine N-acyltransferase [Bacteroidales bacterium]
MEYRVQYIAQYLGGEVVGDGDLKISKVSKIESAKEGSVTFLGNLKYESYLYGNRASAIIIERNFLPKEGNYPTLIKVDDPYAAVTSLLELFEESRERKSGFIQYITRYFRSGISWRAKIERGVELSKGVVVERGAKIGRGAVLYPQVFIGRGALIGRGAILYPGVKVYKGCVVGEESIIHSNAVIGADGFGFLPQPNGSYRKIPQSGNVIIGKRCEIGANSSIDRATMGSTIIGDGVKLDNLIQVAHNCEIGNNTVIAAQSGLSGSVKIGSNCVIGGQVGFADHITIAAGTKIGAQSGIISTIKEEGKSYLGSPAMEAKEYLRAYAIFRKLHKRD